MFLDNVVTQVIVAEGQGKWKEYVGGYTDWERVRDASAAAPVQKKAEVKPAAAAPASAAPVQAKAKKLSYKEQRELEELPQLIAKLEDEQTALNLTLSDPDFYKKTPAEAKRLNERIAQIEEELMTALERWEAIESRNNV
jgi:ATP-binding cassette subfamily F protein uup